MAKYVFVNVPAYGHVNPTLEVIRELVKRDQEVVYFLTEEFRGAVEAVGATLCPYRPFGDGGFEGPLEILERIRALQPDYIVYDAMHMWARTIAEILQVPAILSCPSFVATEQFNPLKDHFNFLGENLAAPTQIPEGFMELVQGVITSVRKKFNLGTFDMRDFYAHAEQLNIVYMPREFQPKNEFFDERYAFVGPSLLKRAEDSAEEKQAQKRTIYISLGTIYNKRADFFKQCFAAFSEGTWDVVVALGKQDTVIQQQAEKVADNFHIENFVEQWKVFPHTGVFVTHGGMNSVMESLYYGVPMVVLPQQAEQAMTARRIVELGLGVALDPDQLTKEQLREAVEQVYADEALYERVQSWKKIVRGAGGGSQAAEALIAFARKHATVTSVS